MILKFYGHEICHKHLSVTLSGFITHFSSIISVLIVFFL